MPARACPSPRTPPARRAAPLPAARQTRPLTCPQTSHRRPSRWRGSRPAWPASGCTQRARTCPPGRPPRHSTLESPTQSRGAPPRRRQSSRTRACQIPGAATLRQSCPHGRPAWQMAPPAPPPPRPAARRT
eukprot:scaffold3617_cov119-Isochrysis_galbana.AAC.5